MPQVDMPGGAQFGESVRCLLHYTEMHVAEGKGSKEGRRGKDGNGKPEDEYGVSCGIYI